MNGDGDFAQLAVVPTGHKKNVKAFLQIAPRPTVNRFLIIRAGKPGTVFKMQNACSET
jgi:hypothetical protein